MNRRDNSFQFQTYYYSHCRRLSTHVISTFSIRETHYRKKSLSSWRDTNCIEEAMRPIVTVVKTYNPTDTWKCIGK